METFIDDQRIINAIKYKYNSKKSCIVSDYSGKFPVRNKEIRYSILASNAKQDNLITAVETRRTIKGKEIKNLWLFNFEALPDENFEYDSFPINNCKNLEEVQTLVKLCDILGLIPALEIYYTSIAYQKNIDPCQSNALLSNGINSKQVNLLVSCKALLNKKTKIKEGICKERMFWAYNSPKQEEFKNQISELNSEIKNIKSLMKQLVASSQEVQDDQFQDDGPVL